MGLMGWIVIGICYLSTLGAAVYLYIRYGYEKSPSSIQTLSSVLKAVIDKQPELANSVGEAIAKSIGTYTGNSAVEGAIISTGALSEEELRDRAGEVTESGIVYPPWEEEPELMMKPEDKML